MDTPRPWYSVSSQSATSSSWNADNGRAPHTPVRRLFSKMFAKRDELQRKKVVPGDDTAG